MKHLVPIERPARFLNIGAALAALMLLAAPIAFPLDGKAHADWQQFLGRFHPLAVHLPIGLLLLVPLLELAGRRRSALRDAASFLMLLSVPACFGTVVLGYLLAYGGGQTGAVVTRHMWSGIALTILVGLCAKVRSSSLPADNIGARRFAYPALLGAILLVMSYAAHQGGTITHGDTYLTEYLPAIVKRMFSIPTAHAATAAPPDSFYARQVHPVLDAKCAGCHGPAKVKGGLRVDSYQALLKGGHNGPAVVAHKPADSLLLQRVSLAHTDEKFMPADGKPPLRREEVALLTAWIADGASLTATSATGIAVHEVEPNFPPVSDYTAVFKELQSVAQSQGVTVVPVSIHPADGLILNTVDAPQAFNTASLAAYEKFSPYIVELELARTSVDDGAFALLATFPHLRVLHLEGTRITGDGLSQLTRLPELSYLNLGDTQVSKSAVKPLAAMKQLRHLYLYNSPAAPNGDGGTPAVAAQTGRRSDG